MSFNPASYPLAFVRPHYLSGHSAWAEHIPFAFAIVEMLRPRVIVELGSHYGDSFCAMCQSVKESKLDARCYAVDTWQGDEHAGFYGDEVLNTLRQAHDRNYSAFSTLVRSTFDEAVAHFGDGTIDLLHIDGLHSYEAVMHDFVTWQPKLSERAVVLFHDTNVHERDFGVWRLWEELSARYPSFSFHHGHGLGVLGVGPNQDPAMRAFFASSGDEAVSTRTFFANLGGTMQREFALGGALHAQNNRVSQLEAELARSTAELQQQLNDARARLEETQRGAARAADQLLDARDELASLRDAPQAAEMRIVELQGGLDRANQTLHEITRSRLWRWSHPIRAMGGGMAVHKRRLSRVQAAQKSVGGWTPLARVVYRTWRTNGTSAVLDRARGFGATLAVAGGEAEQSREQRMLSAIAQRLNTTTAGVIDTDELRANVGTISIVMPVYRVAPHLLSAAVQSVQRQSYPHWELCIADDCSGDANLTRLLDDYASADKRIKVVALPENRGISGASNAALELATGDFIALLDNDDILTFDALHKVAAAIAAHPSADMFYSDECKTDENGAPVEIFAKPDWSPLMMLNCMYVGHLGIYRRSLVNALGGFRSEFDFSQDYDLALRVVEQAREVVHIPDVLYGWRMIASSGSAGGKPYARATNVAALQAAGDRRGWIGKAVALPHANRFQFDLSAVNALVSIIVPSDNRKNIEDTIASINGNTSYRHYEIVVVTNSGIVDGMSAGPLDTRVRLVRYDKPYSFSDKCNAGAAASTGEHLVFFNDDVRVISNDWIEALLEVLLLDGVGIVGPKLLYENGTIQHAGMVTNVRRLVGTAFHSLPADTGKYFNFAQSVREVSLICGACLAMRKDVFDRVAGFDAENAPINHSDVDLCFKVRDLGLTCVYTPHATLLHIGHMSLAEVDKKKTARRKKDPADIFLLRRWPAYLAHDPYFPEAMRDLAFHDSPEPYAVFAPAKTVSVADGGKSILLVSHDLTESGAPRVVLEMARVFSAAGHSVVVVSPSDGPLRIAIQRLGVSVIIDSLVLTRHPSVKDFARNFDLAVANTAVTWPFILQMSSTIQTFWYIHEISLAADLSARYPEFVKALTNATQVFAGSRRAATPLRRFRPNIHVLEYGLDPLTVVDTAETISAGADEPKRTVVSVFASYETRKGQDLFVSAVSLLPTKVLERCEFRLYGRVLDAQFFEGVTQRAKFVPQIKLSTDLCYEDYLSEVLRSDLVVVPSRDDTLPLVSIHALSVGVPLMCTFSTGTSDYIDHGVNGFVISDNAPASMSQALLDALSMSAAAREEIGRAGRTVFDEQFSRDRFSTRLLGSVMQGTEIDSSVEAH